MTRGNPSGLNLHLEKVLHAPKERVFTAFVEAEQLAVWWGPNELHSSQRRDLRS